MSLIESLVVVGIIAALVGFGVPAVRAVLRSLGSEESVQALVQAALSSARSMALEQQRYVGLRFQKASSGEGDGLGNPQYMVFVVHAKDDDRDLAYGFRALEGVPRMRLPDPFNVMDLTVVTRSVDGSRAVKEERIRADGDIDSIAEVNDTTTFSMIFSPAGHLVVMQDIRVRNRDGRADKETPPSEDDVFNTEAQVLDQAPRRRRGMFLQDDYPQRGLGPESSRRSFVVVRTKEFERAFATGQAYSRCLADLQSKVVHVAPLTGALVSRK